MLDICVYLWGNKGAPQKRQKGDKKNAPVSVDRALHSGKLERLEQFFEQFSHCFHSKTRKSDKIALQYLKGLLLANKRNWKEMALVLEDKTNNQSLNHFLNNSVLVQYFISLAVASVVVVGSFAVWESLFCFLMKFIFENDLLILIKCLHLRE